MSEEQSHDYLWLLQQLALLYLHVDIPHPKTIITDGEKALISGIFRVFPRTNNLLCAWHINKNVVKNCKNSFATGEEWEAFYGGWINIIQSSTEPEFQTRWDAFHDTWTEHPECLEYLSDLLFKYHYRRKFVACWTNKVLHFGNTSTSRGEGAHWALKRNLLSSVGDLKTVVDSIDTQLSGQRQEYIGAINMAMSRCPIELKAPWLRDVVAHVTPYALRKILYHWRDIVKQQKDERIQKPCTKTFKIIMGLPCGHDVIKILKQDPPGAIKLEDIHAHWKYNKPHVTAEEPEGNEQIISTQDVIDPLLRVIDPVVVRTKGRPPGSNNKRKTDEHERSTHRNLSGFEHVEREFDAGQRAQILTPDARPFQRQRRRRRQDEEAENTQMMEGGGMMSVFRL